MSFYPLKDSYGTTQLIVNHDAGLSALSSLPVESTVLIEGTVLLRPLTARRPGPAGDIDVQVESFTLLNSASSLPFMASNLYNLPNDDLRARYRYLDLRRTALSDNLKKRSRVAHIVRGLLFDHDFVEVETPVLLRSSPEGAREFLVPTRTSTDISEAASEDPLFYALQQSPQQPKQLLICSGGVDKYFQLARCFRDEDGRKDRQPEFTQIDMEMAFVSWGASESSTSSRSDAWRIGGREVRDIVETLVRTIWQNVEGVLLPESFSVMTYHEAMSRFGSDKPDTRFGLEISNITDILPSRQRLSFDTSKEIIECIVVRDIADHQFIEASRISQFDSAVERITFTNKNQDFWLLHCNTIRDSFPGPSEHDLDHINNALRLKPGDDIWLARRSRISSGGSTALGMLRLHLLEAALNRKDYTVSENPHFLWVTEFPLFTRDDADKDKLAQGRWSSSHHPFTAPMWQDIEAMYNGQIDTVRGQHYDLVLNGVEIGGGSVRVHDAAMQDYIFTQILQLNEKEKAPFDHLLHALRCGAPPHGGIALGFDRLMAMLCNARSIRDVIAFPKTSNGVDLLFKSPAPVDNKMLYQYGVRAR